MDSVSFYLRDPCELPVGSGVSTQSYCNGWTRTDECSSHALEKIILSFNWHFMWITGKRLQRGLGWSMDLAARNATRKALQKGNPAYNAAEVGIVAVSHIWHLWSVRVEFCARQIQEEPSFQSRVFPADVAESGKYS